MAQFDKFTERARKVLQLAQEEAQRFNHNYIGTEHLLLGLVREGDGVAARVLVAAVAWFRLAYTAAPFDAPVREDLDGARFATDRDVRGAENRARRHAHATGAGAILS